MLHALNMLFQQHLNYANLKYIFNIILSARKEYRITLMPPSLSRCTPGYIQQYREIDDHNDQAHKIV